MKPLHISVHFVKVASQGSLYCDLLCYCYLNMVMNPDLLPQVDANTKKRHKLKNKVSKKAQKTLAKCSVLFPFKSILEIKICGYAAKQKPATTIQKTEYLSCLAKFCSKNKCKNILCEINK